MKSNQRWESPTLNLELYFCTEVLKLNSLHYGLWEPGAAATDLADVRAAQARYTQTLVDAIPEGVRRVLDVGCGVGDVAAELTRRGYQVTAISPDRNHARFFEGLPGDRVDFQNVRFEDFTSDQTFDLILMSESQGYFDADTGLSQCRKYLRPGGYLFISGIFKTGYSAGFQGNLVEKAYVRRARTFGFELTRREDITARVLPSGSSAARTSSSRSSC
ncbi:MAG TPA: class I SAM-dependent methyltransferase, partial [Anaerolineaceae bacterium]|nr:class I SAM-dependent methyltransferase [Anaerolineaceae bacterium]